MTEPTTTITPDSSDIIERVKSAFGGARLKVLHVAPQEAPFEFAVHLAKPLLDEAVLEKHGLKLMSADADRQRIVVRAALRKLEDPPIAWGDLMPTPGRTSAPPPPSSWRSAPTTPANHSLPSASASSSGSQGGPRTALTAPPASTGRI